MKLEVGIYVRTKKGIAKITTLDDLDNVAWTDNKDIYFGIKMDDFKWYVDDDGTVLSEPSFNMINLIKIGDYVNGSQVCQIKKDEHNRTWIYVDSNYKYGYLEEDIVDVVTKEQFDAMKYEVERND